MPLVDQLALHKLKLQSRHVFSPLDANYGAIGDGSDESAKIQDCIDEAESVPGSIVLWNPPVTFGLGSTLLLGQGPYSTKFIGASAVANNNPDFFTFTKLANVTALKVVHAAASEPVVNDVTIKGRGAAAAVNTDPLLDSTPAMILSSRCRVERAIASHTGGVTGLGEAGTAGAAFMILQEADGGNCNSIRLLWASSFYCTGDAVYVGKIAGTLNLNGCFVIVDKVYKNYDGHAVNLENGFDNEFKVFTFDCHGTSPRGAFRSQYVGNDYSVNYIENTSCPHLIELGAQSGGVTCRGPFDKVVTPVKDGLYRNAILRDRVSGKTYFGDPTGGAQHEFKGHAVQFSSGLSLPNPLANGHVKVQEAAYADIGASLDIVSSAVQGTVTWTTRFARCAKVGCLVQLYVTLAGAVNVASTNNGRLNIATGDMTFENGGNLGGPACNLRLTNSAVTAKPVSLTWKSATQLQIVDALTGANMTFNDVVGANTFTLEGAITLLDRQGMA